MNDHRRLGRELGLYHLDPLVGAGLPIWLPDGAAARHAVEEYVREQERRAGYRHVHSPPLAHRELFERSGHLPHFGDDMFPAFGDDDLVLRPSLCPHHALVYAARGRSHRDLPLRIAEIGPMYRAERSGVVGGLARVRAISLNDAHIFCAPDQAAAVAADVLRLMQQVHRALGVRLARFRLSLRESGGGGKYVDDPELWQRAEAMLRKALAAAGLPYHEAPGEAAFYGPKIDAQIVDSAGREWSIATVQIDLHQPARFALSYVDARGRKQQPVMVHRSLVGSLERLFAHLIEVHDGAFPIWYAPVQVVALPVGGDQVDAASAFVAAAVAAGLRAELEPDGSLGARIRASAQRRVPYAAVVGAREAAGGEVSLRRRDGRALDAMPAADAVRLLVAEAAPPSG
jgi:threonyl-tRNA synthetase